MKKIWKSAIIISIVLIMIGFVSAGLIIQTEGITSCKAPLGYTEKNIKKWPSFEILSISGINGTNEIIEEMDIIIKTIGSASNYINLETVNLIISVNGIQKTQQINKSNIKYIQKGSKYTENCISLGDVVVISTYLDEKIHKNQSINITIIPKNKIPTKINILSPKEINNYRVHLYP